jgi:hypothetical protein
LIRQGSSFDNGAVVASESNRTRFLLFGSVALLVAVTWIVLLRSPLYGSNPDVASWGATFDLAISIPLVYYVLLIRPRRVHPFSIVPLFIGCLAVARFVVPRPHQELLHTLELLSAPLEVVAIGYLISRTRRASRRFRTAEGGDWLGRFRSAVAEVTGSELVSHIVAGEVAVWYYAIFSWGRRRAVPEGQTAITVHEQGGWGAVLAALMIVLIGESTAVHFVIQHWSVTAAWIVTGTELYAVLWFIADARALNINPTIVSPERLHIRFGLRWTADVPLASLASIERVTTQPDAGWRRPGLLKLAVLSDPQYIIHLSEPVTSHAMFGIHRQISEIAVAPDDPASFERVFSRWLA